MLEESPTPVDELLTASPTDVDAPEIFEAMRFDDNTPLPDDFELDAPVAPREPVVEAPVAVEPPEHLQVDLELGDPDDWEELLDEFGEPEMARDEPDEGDVESPPEQVGELLDVDTQFALQAEALGISPSGLHEAVDEAAVAEPETPPKRFFGVDGRYPRSCIFGDSAPIWWSQSAVCSNLPNPQTAGSGNLAKMQTAWTTSLRVTWYVLRSMDLEHTAGLTKMPSTS